MRKNRQSNIVKNEKFWKGFYTFSGIFGVILITFEVLIYRLTIINVYIPILIILLIGILTFYFNKEHYKKTYGLTGNFFPVLQNIISWGFTACFIFIAMNYYLSDETTSEYKFKIKEKSSMPGSKKNRNERQPLVRIDYFTFEKELVFGYSQTENINKADSVKVIIRKGLLGFDIIDSYYVVN